MFCHKKKNCGFSGAYVRACVRHISSSSCCSCCLYLFFLHVWNFENAQHNNTYPLKMDLKSIYMALNESQKPISPAENKSREFSVYSRS